MTQLSDEVVEFDRLYWQIAGIIADMRTWEGLPIKQHVDGSEIGKAAGRIRASLVNCSLCQTPNSAFICDDCGRAKAKGQQ